jgi:DNA-binding CsgD family transcriptional regulator
MPAPGRSAFATRPDAFVASEGVDVPLAIAVDSLRQGILVFDASGHVLSANATARRTIESCADVRLVAMPGVPFGRLRLRVRRTASQLQLERALRESASRVPTLATATNRDPRGTHAVVLSDDSGRARLILQLSPIPSTIGGRATDERPAVIGLLIDRGTVPVLDPQVLCDLFGLTDAESRVAGAYLRVDTVKDVAAMLGVSVNTVKTHLGSVYVKTGCTRQAQLVRLLMSLSEMADEPPDAAR